MRGGRRKIWGTKEHKKTLRDRSFHLFQTKPPHTLPSFSPTATPFHCLHTVPPSSSPLSTNNTEPLPYKPKSTDPTPPSPAFTDYPPDHHEAGRSPSPQMPSFPHPPELSAFFFIQQRRLAPCATMPSSFSNSPHTATPEQHSLLHNKASRTDDNRKKDQEGSNDGKK